MSAVSAVPRARLSAVIFIDVVSCSNLLRLFYSVAQRYRYRYLRRSCDYRGMYTLQYDYIVNAIIVTCSDKLSRRAIPLWQNVNSRYIASMAWLTSNTYCINDMPACNG